MISLVKDTMSEHELSHRYEEYAESLVTISTHEGIGEADLSHAEFSERKPRKAIEHGINDPGSLTDGE